MGRAEKGRLRVGKGFGMGENCWEWEKKWFVNGSQKGWEWERKVAGSWKMIGKGEQTMLGMGEKGLGRGGNCREG